MIETGIIIALCLFCAGVGMAFSETMLERNRQKARETKIINIEEEPEEELTPMTLRNGMGVTRDEKPTFAEQWVNIMNYNGESQLEEDYEEGENINSAEYLGRVS